MTGKDEKKPKKRPPGTPPRGRPPRHQGEQLSKNRTFRVRGGLDEKLQAAAAASGRSVSEEIEFRLDQSFDRDAFIGLVLGGDENSKVLQTIATVMKLESRAGHWMKDMKTVERVGRAAIYVITYFAPQYASLRPPPELMAQKALQFAGPYRPAPWTENDETRGNEGETK